MNISNRDKMLLLILLGIALFLIADLGISKSYNTKADAIQAQINSLTPQLTKLRDYNSKLSTYQDGINKSGSSISAELLKLPDDVRSEDMLMYATKLESAVGIAVNRITVSQPELVSRFDLPEKTADGFKLVPTAALRSGVTIDCGLSYSQFKKLITYIYNTPEMTTLKSVTVSFNSESGGLTGIVVMEKYFISNEDYTYSKTTIPPVDKGNENLFGTFSVTPSSSAAGNTN